MKIVNHIAIAFIRLYQWCVSPLIGTHCRFEPSCSHYADESITRHGLAKGIFLTVKRLFRCHPYGSSGYDPVPPSVQE